MASASFLYSSTITGLIITRKSSHSIEPDEDVPSWHRDQHPRKGGYVNGCIEMLNQTNYAQASKHLRNDIQIQAPGEAMGPRYRGLPWTAGGRLLRHGKRIYAPIYIRENGSAEGRL